MILRLVLQLLVLLLVMALVLLLAAGDPSWPAAWAFLVEVGILGLAVGLWLAGRDPALLSRRLQSPWRAETAPGDQRRMVMIAVGFVLWLGLMGLDARRYRFLPAPTAVHGVGLLLVAAAFFVTWRAFSANSFAATTVAVQPGQQVAQSGPYALVRHPIYAGTIFFFVGAPLMLGSWLGLIAAPLFVLAMGRRALAEERLLTDNLPGYRAYAAKVRFRMVPYLW